MRSTLAPVLCSVPPAMARVLVTEPSPRLLLAAMLTMPPLMFTAPEFVLVPLKNSVPVFVLVRLVLPLTAPEIVSALLPVTSTVPPPVPRATVRFAVRSTFAPVLCSVPFAMVRALVTEPSPRCVLAPMLIVPPLMVTPPEFVFVPLRVSLPLPLFVRVPVPVAMLPLIRVLPEPVTSRFVLIPAMLPARVKRPALRLLQV